MHSGRWTEDRSYRGDGIPPGVWYKPYLGIKRAKVTLREGEAGRKEAEQAKIFFSGTLRMCSVVVHFPPPLLPQLRMG